MEDNEEESGEAAAAPSGQQQKGRAALNVLGRVVVGAARCIHFTEDMLLSRLILFFVFPGSLRSTPKW